MGFDDNERSVPDALPRYVEEFADRFEAGDDGPSERFHVTARLALGHDITGRGHGITGRSERDGVPTHDHDHRTHRGVNTHGTT